MSSPPWPAQPQPASATQSGQSCRPAISIAPNCPHSSHAAASLTGLGDLDSTNFQTTKYTNQTKLIPCFVSCVLCVSWLIRFAKTFRHRNRLPHRHGFVDRLRSEEHTSELQSLR